MSDVQKQNPDRITPTENKDGAEHMTRKVSFKSTMTLYNIPYYNRKMKDCPWEKYKEKDRIKIKRELDEFKRTEMTIHDDSRRNTSFYYHQDTHSQYSYSGSRSCSNSVGSVGSQPQSQRKRQVHSSSSLSIEDFFNP